MKRQDSIFAEIVPTFLIFEISRHPDIELQVVYRSLDRPEDERQYANFAAAGLIQHLGRDREMARNAAIWVNGTSDAYAYGALQKALLGVDLLRHSLDGFELTSQDAVTHAGNLARSRELLDCVFVALKARGYPGFLAERLSTLDRNAWNRIELIEALNVWTFPETALWRRNKLSLSGDHAWWK